MQSSQVVKMEQVGRGSHTIAVSAVMFNPLYLKIDNSVIIFKQEKNVKNDYLKRGRSLMTSHNFGQFLTSSP